MWPSIDETLSHESRIDGQHRECSGGERCSIGKIEVESLVERHTAVGAEQMPNALGK